MDDNGLRALRFAATLADVASSVRLRFRSGDRVMFRVARERVDGSDGTDAPICHPDAFRASVARSLRGHLLGEPPGVLEALATDAPAIDVGLLPGDQALPGGIYRLQAGERHLHLLMTTLAPSSCERLLARTFGEWANRESGGPPACGVRHPFGIHDDQLTEVSVVHLFAPAIDVEAAHSAMERTLEILVIAEMCADLGFVVLDGPSFEARR